MNLFKISLLIALVFNKIDVIAQEKLTAQTNTSNPAKELLKSEDYIKRYGDLANTVYNIKTRKSLNVVFFGGSITHNPGWRDKITAYLQQNYLETKFNMLNAGIPSLGSLAHAFRLENDVLNKGAVDLMFLEAAVNDLGTNEQTQRKALEGIIRHTLKVNPNANIVLMAFVDPAKMKDYNAGKIPVEVQVHEDLARMYHLPFINLAKEVTDRINAGEFTWEKDFKGLHPAPFGQEVYFHTMQQLLSVALNKPTPNKPDPSFLPPPGSPLAYSHGKYLDVNDAAMLKDFTLDPVWKPADSVGTRSGFVNVPVLAGDKPGASFELTFTGTAVGFAVLSGPDAGAVRYIIDGKEYPELDLYTQWSYNLHLPWYLLLGDGLIQGKHLLKLEINANHNEKSKGTACRVVHFLINN